VRAVGGASGAVPLLDEGASDGLSRAGRPCLVKFVVMGKGSTPAVLPPALEALIEKYGAAVRSEWTVGRAWADCSPRLTAGWQMGRHPSGRVWQASLSMAWVRRARPVIYPS
jgi:hypothetical protein